MKTTAAVIRLALMSVAAAGFGATRSAAQPLGTFSWQQQPYCNVITVAVVQTGSIYQLDGTDDQCAATRKASATGLAFLNPDGSIGIGLTLVTNAGGAMGGAPLHIDATIALATLHGTWRDNTGRTGPFTFVPTGSTGGSPRPVPTPTFTAGLVASQVYGNSPVVRTGSEMPPELSGVRGESLEGVGVYGRGDVSNSSTFYNEGGYFEGGKGLYARGTDSSGEQGYGARIFSDQFRGMYVQGDNNWFDAYFGGDTGISTFGIVNRAPLTSLAVNLGDDDIEPGDLVAIAGVASPVEGDQPMLGVARLNPGNLDAVIGVAVSAFGVSMLAHENRRQVPDFSPTAGAVKPSGYLSIMTSGLAPAVNIESLLAADERNAAARQAALESASVGDRVGFSGTVSIGRVAAPADAETGTIAVFLQIR